MKRSFLVAFLTLVLLAGASLAEVGRYTIFNGVVGGFGLTAKKVPVLLDTETGETWRYHDNKWKPIPVIGPEKTLTQAIEEFLAEEEGGEGLLAAEENSEKKTEAKKEIKINTAKKKVQAPVKKIARKAAAYSKPKVRRTRTVKKKTYTAAPKVKPPSNEPPEWL